jgi:hypothetical protein
MRTPTKHFQRKIRRICHLTAFIVLAGRERQECQVLDVSMNGAKVITDTPSQVPSRFELAFTRGDRHRLCEVIWRRGKMIGVQFV